MNSIDKASSELAGFIFDKIVNPLIILFFVIAVIYFLYGATKFILKAKDEKGRVEGSQHLLWGSIGLTIMFTAVAITYFVGNTANVLLKGSGATQGLENVGRLEIK